MLIKAKIAVENSLTQETSSIWGLIDLNNVGAVSQHVDNENWVDLYNDNGEVIYVIEEPFNAVCDKFIKSKTEYLSVGNN